MNITLHARGSIWLFALPFDRLTWMTPSRVLRFHIIYDKPGKVPPGRLQTASAQPACQEVRQSTRVKTIMSQIAAARSYSGRNRLRKLQNVRRVQNMVNLSAVSGKTVKEITSWAERIIRQVDSGETQVRTAASIS